MNSKRAWWMTGAAAVVLLAAVFLPSMLRGPGPARQPVLPGNQSRIAPEMAQMKTEPTISLYRHATGAKEQIKFEKYLEGVLAAEVGGKMPMEALKSQAIAARSMSMAKIKYIKDVQKLHGTDACDLPEHFQAYNPNLITPSIRQAVQETRGMMILADTDGRAAYALFHAYSPHRTAAITEAFPQQQGLAGSYIRSVPSPGEKYAPAEQRNWTVSFPKAAVAAAFGTQQDVGDIKVTRTGPSGRALDVTAGGKTIKSYDLRTKLGGTKLKSTMFTVKNTGDQIVFTGQGWGHGCGMAQWGAVDYANRGQKATQILNQYYPNTHLVQVYR
ncbi:MAG: SpoIID/LytB domain-containing protein [Solirubrobacterales bacterium]